MDIYKIICRNVVVPLWATYERSPYLKHLKHLDKSQYFNFEEIRAMQWEKLKKLLNHAYKNISFYRRRFDSEGIQLDAISSWEDYSKVPFLTKEDVRNHKGSLFAPNFDKYIKFYTSGSTGIPIEGYRNKICNEFKRACGLRSSLWSGYNLGERVYCLYGNPEKKKTWKGELRRKLLDRVEFLDTLNLSEKSMMEFASVLRRKPPSLIYGHAHNMYIFSRFLEKKRINDIKPKGMYSAGMVLHDWEKEQVERVFNCKFQDRYGCEELGLIAAECKKQEGLHINTDDLYVEFINKAGKSVAPGIPGHIVITDLSNYVMPFIRYKIGDIGIPSDKKCSCGKTQPLIERIQGRVADFIITPEGKCISGISLTDHFGASIPGVAQMQIVQEKIDLLTLNIVKGNGFNDNSLATIRDLVKTYFGENMRFDCKFVEKIPQEASGKYRFTICKIDNPFL